MPPSPKRRQNNRNFVVAAVLVAGVAAAGTMFTMPSAVAQGWWPWSNNSDSRPPPQPPLPREPVWRGGPGQPPPPLPPGSQPPPAQQGWGAATTAPGGKPPICLQLEQRLVMERQRGNAPREMLPKIEGDIRQLERQQKTLEIQLDRADCWDSFLFSRTLRRTRQCVDIAGQLEINKRRTAELDAQRHQIVGTRDRSYEDDIIRDLARNGCGAAYNQEAQRRGGFNPFSSLWQDEDTGPMSRGSEFGALPFATYRTVCVRLCDGYFFPVSFSTLPTHFEKDIEVCQSKCAAPAELFYYQNPGGAMEQAVSARNQTPYANLKSAFRYRKEFVQGCSCKQAEYTPSPADRGDRRAEAPASGAGLLQQPPTSRSPQR